MAEIKDFNRNQYLLKGGKDKNNKEKESDSDKKSMDNTLARYRQVKLCRCWLWRQWLWSVPTSTTKIRCTLTMK